MSLFEAEPDHTVTDSPPPPGDDRPPVPRPIPASDYFPQTTPWGLAAVVLLCGIFLCTSFHRLNHTDLWGHLCFGRWLVENGPLPEVDPFSATTPHKTAPLVNVPWLAQMIGYGVLRYLGLEGLVLGHAALAMLSCAVLIFATRCRGVHPIWAVGAGAVCYLIALPIIGTIRPQLAGLLGFPFVLVACALVRDKNHPFLWLPIVFALWANLHGSFVLGLALLGICAVGDSWDAMREIKGESAVWSLREIRRRWSLLLLCTIAACLNPQGPRLLLLVASFGGNPALADITEWRQLVIKSLGGTLFFSSLVLTALVIRYSKLRFLAYEVLLLVAFGALALMSMRMLAWWAMVWPWVLLRHVSSLWQPTGDCGEDSAYPTASRNTMRTLYALACVFITVLWAPPSQGLLHSTPRGIGTITSSDTPLYVADEMRRRRVRGRIFCPLDWGDFLIWRTHAAVKPLVYSHVHLVAPSVWTDYLLIYQGVSNWLELADRYQLDYLVLSRQRNGRLRRSIERHPRAEILYQDQQSLLVGILPAPRRDQSAEGS